MEIKKTRMYDIFRFKKENREINYNKVASLKSKLIENGRQIVPIICNREMEVIDGQHRLEALKELGWEVTYYVDESVTVNDLISINNTQKNWGLMDYIHFYASSGNDTYIELERICRENEDLPLKVVLAAIQEKYVHERDIKAGKLSFSEEEIAKGKECLEYIKGMRREIRIKITQPANFFFLIVKTYYLIDIDRERLYKMIVERYGTENYGNAEQCARVIENWYNHKLRSYRYISNEILPKR